MMQRAPLLFLVTNISLVIIVVIDCYAFWLAIRFEMEFARRVRQHQRSQVTRGENQKLHAPATIRCTQMHNSFCVVPSTSVQQQTSKKTRTKDVERTLEGRIFFAFVVFR